MIGRRYLIAVLIGLVIGFLALVLYANHAGMDREWAEPRLEHIIRKWGFPDFYTVRKEVGRLRNEALFLNTCRVAVEDGFWCIALPITLCVGLVRLTELAKSNIFWRFIARVSWIHLRRSIWMVGNGVGICLGKHAA